MSVVYITEQGLSLQLKDNQIRVMRNREFVMNIPLFTVERVIIQGITHLSTNLMTWLMKENVDLVFLSKHGEFRGRLCGRFNSSVKLRSRQYRASENEGERLTLARQFVRGKLKNQHHYLIRIQRRTLAWDARQIDHAVDGALTLDQLRGVEGNFSRKYWQEFGEVIKEPLKFTGRKKHPPPDPVNIMLSYLYTLLYSNVSAVIQAVGLDPYRGFLHDDRHSHLALASDLMEEFRTPVVDAVVVNVVNRGMITDSHFKKDENKKYKMEPHAASILIEQYQLKMAERVPYEEQKLNYYQILEKQCRRLGRHLFGMDEYHPFERIR